MSTKYCMKCGAMNELDANFCKKCANSFSLTETKARKATPPPPELEEYEEEEVVPARLRKRRGPVGPPQRELLHTQATRPTIVQESGEGLSIELAEGEDDNSEGDGVSLNFVPEVTRLEIESIQVDQVKGVTFGALVEEANRRKAQGLPPQ